VKKSIVLLAFVLLVAACQGEKDFCGSVSGIPVSECRALVSFYHSTDGPNWTDKRGWLETKHPCEWYGVSCTDGRVTAITINYNNLNGRIPPEIENLPKLKTISLYYNSLNGAIPTELSKLSELQVLILHDNDLSGNIPPELGNMTHLKMLDLESNELSGSIPPELGNLSNLEALKLSTNKLTGSIPPELGKLSHVWMILLCCNDLGGSVPSELGELPKLQQLSFFDNKDLSEDIPPSLENMPRSGYDVIWVEERSPD
jgi:Leucine-rich repeat (LRR) protein